MNNDLLTSRDEDGVNLEKKRHLKTVDNKKNLQKINLVRPIRNPNAPEAKNPGN